MAFRGPPGFPQFTAVASAQLTAADGAAAALTSTALFSEADGVGMAAMQADPANTGTVKLGDADGQHVTLAAGEWFPFLLFVTNVSLLHALGSAAGQKLNLLVFK